MRGTIKKISILCFALCFIIYSVMFASEKLIPDEITVIENENYEVPKIYGIDIYSIGYDNSFNKIVKAWGTTNKSVEIKLLNIIPVKNTVITKSERQYVILGGELFGIKLYTDGVIIVDFDEIETENGKVSPGKNSGLRKGDIIKAINNTEISSASHLSKFLRESKGEELKITFVRNGETKNTIFKTVTDTESGSYKAGLWVRDSTAGLGTVTFYNKNNNTFAGLGHPIYDIDTNEIMPMKSGVMADVKLSGMYKSTFGNVGELCGTFTGENKGELCLNDETGIYGYTITDKKIEVPVAVKQEVKTGEAQIYCTIKGNTTQCYNIEITKIYSNSSSVNKDMIIKITDEKLLNETGGIVQGMSGSPIIQDGKLVGAVTHVFVNNPKQGYAIFAERMLETSNKQPIETTDELKSIS